MSDLPGVSERSTFARFPTGARRVREGPVLVAWLRDDEGRGSPMVAYAISRKVGGAVVRNRIRRRLRAVNRELAPRFRPGAYLMTARVEAASMPYEQLRASVSRALERVFEDGGAGRQ